MFDRIVSIDWSGAGSETERVGLRVAEYAGADGNCRLVAPVNAKAGVRAWTRADCRQWLREKLREPVCTLVAMDFGFGLPWGSDEVVFGVTGWREMIGKIAGLYQQFGTARATAKSINELPRFSGHGPFRFDDGRTDFRFYLDHGISYFRLTELAAPQAISQWYFGSGGKVGFHTVTGLSALHWLLQLRDKEELDFEVWPHECLKPTGSKHVLVESYPAICPRLPDYGDCEDDDQRDAWRVLQFVLGAARNGSLLSLFEITPSRFGRISEVDFWQQVQFEGYIFGLK